MYHPVPEAAIAASGNDSAAAFAAVSADLAAGCRAVARWDRGPSADPPGVTRRSASVLQADRADRSTFQSARGLAPFTEDG